MARPIISNEDQSIYYFQRPGSKIYQIAFYPPPLYKEKKLTLKTSSESQANIYVKHMESVRDLHKIHEDILDPEYDKIDEMIYIYYFNQPKKKGSESLTEAAAFILTDYWMKETDKDILIKQLQKEIINKDKKINGLEGQLKILSDNIYAKQVLAAQDIKSNKEVLTLYFDWMVSDDLVESKNYLRRIQSLLDANPGKNIIDISHQDITGWLIKHVASKERGNPVTTWNNGRLWFTKFYKWASVQWDFLNPTLKVQIKKNKDYKDIEWHELNELEKMITDIEKNKDIDPIYWQTLIGVMAYAGLSQHEVRSLQTKNIDMDQLTLRVTPSKEANVKLKNIKRVRTIKINEHLEPLLRAYLKSDYPGKHAFPDLYTKNRKAKPPWKTGSTLSQLLHGRGLRKRILPEYLGEIKCNCLSLRRSFGSLLLRSGCTAAEVAAAMGNTITMVENHYARILGEEVKTSLRPKLILADFVIDEKKAN